VTVFRPRWLVLALVVNAATAGAAIDPNPAVAVYDGLVTLRLPEGWHEIPPTVLEYFTLSTAEAISVMASGLSLAAHYGDGVVHAGDLAAGLVGAIVKDPVQDRIIWMEYLETVVKERDGWKDLYRSCREVL